MCTPIIARLYADIPLRGSITEWEKTAAALVERYPDGITLPRGTGERDKGPIETLKDALSGSPSPAGIEVQG